MTSDLIEVKWKDEHQYDVHISLSHINISCIEFISQISKETGEKYYGLLLGSLTLPGNDEMITYLSPEEPFVLCKENPERDFGVLRNGKKVQGIIKFRHDEGKQLGLLETDDGDVMLKDLVEVKVVTWTNLPTIAFSDCVALRQVNFGERLTGFGKWAFSMCISLKEVIIPVGVTSIGSDAFYGCTSLSAVTIPVGITSIGIGAFSGCTSLTAVTIPVGVTCIGEGAFDGYTTVSYV
jgi:hypothetical protein